MTEVIRISLYFATVFMIQNIYCLSVCVLWDENSFKNKWSLTCNESWVSLKAPRVKVWFHSRYFYMKLKGHYRWVFDLPHNTNVGMFSIIWLFSYLSLTFTKKQHFSYSLFGGLEIGFQQHCVTVVLRTKLKEMIWLKYNWLPSDVIELFPLFNELLCYLWLIPRR